MIVIICGGAAAMQIYNLSRRIYEVEKNMNFLLGAIETAIKMSEAEKKKNDNAS